MSYLANGYQRHTLTFSDSGLSLLQSATIKVNLPVDNGKTRIVFSDNRAMDVKALLKQYAGTKIDTLQIKVYDYANVLKNTYTYTNVQLVPTETQVPSVTNSVVNHVVNIVSDSMTKTNDW